MEPGEIQVNEVAETDGSTYRKARLTLKNSDTLMRLCSTNSCTRSISSTSWREGRGWDSTGWNTSVWPRGAVVSPAAISGRVSFGKVVSITAFGFRYSCNMETLHAIVPYRTEYLTSNLGKYIGLPDRASTFALQQRQSNNYDYIRKVGRNLEEILRFVTGDVSLSSIRRTHRILVHAARHYNCDGEFLLQFQVDLPTDGQELSPLIG